MEKQQLQKIIEGALLAYGQPLTLDKLYSLFVTESTETDEGEQLPTKAQVEKKDILEALEAIEENCANNGFELKKVSSGWRFQVREETAAWVNKLWEEKPQRYSRALMETIAIIAYRQPITRGDIEEIRGVAVSSNIIKTLSEREWVKVVGQRDVPGRPSLYATTKQFLDYFNLSSLEELPSLKELTDIESLTPELDLSQGEATTLDQSSSENTSEDHEANSVSQDDHAENSSELEVSDVELEEESTDSEETVELEEAVDPQENIDSEKVVGLENNDHPETTQEDSNDPEQVQH